MYQSKKQVNIPEVPFHQKMFNSQILIRPKLQLQSWMTEELNKEHTSCWLAFLQNHFPTSDFIYCHENDTCHQKLQCRHHLTHYQGGEKGRVWGGFFYSRSKEVGTRERKTETGESLLTMPSFKAPHERRQN